ncbi:MAG: DUF3592 domain-containing protein [Acidobacteria bacterium]|nr:DUF3592 domain-containing protein [Acidobacteriota bacterium]
MNTLLPRAALSAALLATSVPALAAPDFSTSEVRVSSESPLEAEIVTFTVVLRNSGSEDAGSVYFSTEWPLMGFLVDASGFDGAEVDHEARTLTLSFPLEAGAEREFAVRVLAPRDSGGDALTLAIRAAHFTSGTEHWDRRTVTIETRTGTGGVMVAGLRIAPAGLATGAVLAFGAILWLMVRLVTARVPSAGVGAGFARLVEPRGAVMAVTVSIGFWILFGAMAWRDYRSLTSWPETTCTILGGRLTANGTTRPGRTGVSGGAPRDDTNYVPVLGLRYMAGDRLTYSSGYDTGSRLGVGGRGGRLDELSTWTIGDSVPCWYDPDDPLDVVVVNGFGGAYLFALLPLPVFLIGAARLRSLVRGRADADDRR